MKPPAATEELLEGFLDVLARNAALQPRAEAVLTASLYDQSCTCTPRTDGTCPGCDARLEFAVKLEQHLAKESR